jgi:predicted transcriptional regulator
MPTTNATMFLKELLARGYHQYEIANTLHISQPTISRDIHYIQKEMRYDAENYDNHRFEVYRNNLRGLDEMIKNYGQLQTRQKQTVRRR